MSEIKFFNFFFSFICSIFPFSGEQVRVLLFRECDWTGRRLLFDSSAVQKVSISETNQSNTTTNDQNGKLPNSNVKDGGNSSRAFIEICNGYGYTYDQTSCESNNIGEMVFGSVAMSFKGTSLKVNTKQKHLFSLSFISNFNNFFSFIKLGTLASRTNANNVLTSISVANLSEK